MLNQNQENQVACSDQQSEEQDIQTHDNVLFTNTWEQRNTKFLLTMGHLDRSISNKLNAFQRNGTDLPFLYV